MCVISWTVLTIVCHMVMWFRLFGGNPIRNADGDFVCDGAPEGTVDTANDFALGTDCNAKIGRDCLENEHAIHVYPNFGTPFPPVTPNQCTGGPECRAVSVLNDGGAACLEAHEDCSYIQGTQYRLALSAGQAIQEIVRHSRKLWSNVSVV